MFQLAASTLDGFRSEIRSGRSSMKQLSRKEEQLVPDLHTFRL